jgi:general secretion pathway protein N
MDAVVAVRLDSGAAFSGSVAGNRTQMTKWPKNIGLALLFSLVPTVGWVSSPHAATSATTNILSNDGAGEIADPVDIGSMKPLSKPNRDANKPLQSGNPLWSIPLSVLTATQQRPIFSTSRRPPQRAVVAPALVSAPAPAKVAAPEHPPLALIGAVVGESDAIAVFLDRTNQKIVRLRQGESHAGWLLNSIQPREVTLKKADQTEVIVLQHQVPPAGAPGMMMPGNVGSYAPFVPRSTPKNGAPDGL